MRRRLRNFGGRTFRGVIAVAALCIAVGVVVAVGVKVPAWERKANALPNAKDQLAAETEIFTTLIQIAGGLVVVTGLYFTSRTIYVAQEGQITERFNKAIDHLGDETLAVRMGGIYALARIAADSARDAATIVEIFASFVREATAGTTTLTPADVRAIVTILGTTDWARDTVIDFRGCRFVGLNLERLDLRNALLGDTVFHDCRLPGTKFDGASLLAADFADANLRDCSFRGCDVQVANFENSSLRSASFVGASLFGAKFGSSSLLGADFEGATGAIRQQFEEAIVDETTRLPKFDGL
jgi:hypothetical protein